MRPCGSMRRVSPPPSRSQDECGPCKYSRLNLQAQQGLENFASFAARLPCRNVHYSVTQYLGSHKIAKIIRIGDIEHEVISTISEMARIFTHPCRPRQHICFDSSSARFGNGIESPKRRQGRNKPTAS